MKRCCDVLSFRNVLSLFFRRSSSNCTRLPKKEPFDAQDVAEGTTAAEFFAVQQEVSEQQSCEQLQLRQNPTLFRGISARSGVSIALGNNFKPDPILRHQLTIDNQQDVLEATMVPLAKLNYDEQLLFKYERNKRLIRNLSRTIARRIPRIHLDNDGLICPVDPVIPSPVLSKFRNKDEFSVGQGIDGFPKKVGYFVGRSRENDVVCVFPRSLPNIRDSHMLVAQRFQDYILASPFDACRQGLHGFEGHWKAIVVRSNKAGDVMASVIMHPQSLTEEELNAEKDKLRNFFENGAGKDCNLKSLYFQACPHSFCNHLTAPYQLLYGDAHIVEHCGHMKFRISPSAFFQINVEAAEVMYQKVGQLLKPDPNAILLDVCCGTGTIGLFLANKFDKVLGVEQDFMAVHDACHNAELNGIANATFYCDVAEKGIPRLLKNRSFNYSNVSVVVNPGRGGLSVRLINALRKTPQVDRIVYISCKPIGNAMRNIIDLCLPTSRDLTGEPFFPTRVVPVDMFPHTDHCELLITYERNRVYFV